MMDLSIRVRELIMKKTFRIIKLEMILMLNYLWSFIVKLEIIMHKENPLSDNGF